MRWQKEESVMETERTDAQIQVLSNLDTLPNAMETSPAWLQESPSFSAVNGASHVSQGSTWVTLLEAAQGQRRARLMYCLVFKRWFDVLMASLAVVALTPLLLIIALVIWFDTRGSVIYRQPRIGRYGRPFVMYKFRTMIPDRRQGTRPYGGPERRRAHKTTSDPRVTRTGRFMRRSSLDELPQLFNVLRGEMSLVGPRPELPEIVRNYEPWQHRRHLVLPGITGWWQTHGRSDLMMHEHTELDIYYIENISLGMDIRILLRTLRTFAPQSGAF